jgi:Cu/Zn superoxide dismutase
MRNSIKFSALAAAAVAVPLVLAGTADASTPSAASVSSHRFGQHTRLAGGVLLPVATNHVLGIGFASVSLRGDTARVTVDATGLLNGVPHAMHIHVDGNGTCPTAWDSKIHNGNRSIDVADAMKEYGTIGTSLTTSGDTSPASALAVSRFPDKGTFHYSRTIKLSAETVKNIDEGKAVVVVHGIDYNRNGTYDNVLGASELDSSLPAEATDPALCGTLR